MEAISELIKSGLLKDLHIAERSFKLNRQINTKHTKIPAGIKSDISIMLYDLSYTEMVMSLCRLYDNPSPKYPTRCLKRLYNILEQKDYNIPIMESPNLALKELRHLLEFADMFNYLVSQQGIEFNRRVIEYLQTIEINDPIASAIDKIKEVRDKFLGHNEDVNLDTMVPYKSVEVLIRHAKEVVSFFALCYTGIRLTTGTGDFYLSHSTFNWAAKFDKFIRSDED